MLGREQEWVRQIQISGMRQPLSADRPRDDHILQ